jgi:hypothetical protein
MSGTVAVPLCIRPKRNALALTIQIPSRCSRPHRGIGPNTNPHSRRPLTAELNHRDQTFVANRDDQLLLGRGYHDQALDHLEWWKIPYGASLAVPNPGPVAHPGPATSYIMPGFRGIQIMRPDNGCPILPGRFSRRSPRSRPAELAPPGIAPSTGSPAPSRPFRRPFGHQGRSTDEADAERGSPS